MVIDRLTGAPIGTRRYGWCGRGFCPSYGTQRHSAVGPGQPARALRIALTGRALAFLLTEAIGVVAAIWPCLVEAVWQRPADAGNRRHLPAHPAYGFFGLGLSLYFASQGAGRLLWPLLAGLCRMLIALGGGGLTLYLTSSPHWLLGFLALALVMYDLILAIAVRSGVWFRTAQRDIGAAASPRPLFFLRVEIVKDRMNADHRPRPGVHRTDTLVATPIGLLWQTASMLGRSLTKARSVLACRRRRRYIPAPVCETGPGRACPAATACRFQSDPDGQARTRRRPKCPK